MSAFPGLCGSNKDLFCSSVYRYTFNGKELESTLGLDFEARLYKPELGRWLSVDPKQSKYPALGTYVFCANIPTVFTDPNGEEIRFTKNITNDQISLFISVLSQATGLKFQVIEPKNQNDLRKLEIVDTGEPQLNNPSATKIRELVIANIKRSGIGINSHIIIGHLDENVDGDRRNYDGTGSGLNSNMLSKGGAFTEKLLVHYFIEQNAMTSRNLSQSSASAYDLGHDAALKWEANLFLKNIGFSDLQISRASNNALDSDQFWGFFYDNTDSYRVLAGHRLFIGDLQVGFVDRLQKFNQERYLVDLLNTVKDGVVNRNGEINMPQRHEDKYWDTINSQTYGQDVPEYNNNVPNSK